MRILNDIIHAHRKGMHGTKLVKPNCVTGEAWNLGCDERRLQFISRCYSAVLWPFKRYHKTKVANVKVWLGISYDGIIQVHISVKMSTYFCENKLLSQAICEHERWTIQQDMSTQCPSSSPDFNPLDYKF